MGEQQQEGPIIHSCRAQSRELKDLDFTHDDLPTERALDVQWCTEGGYFYIRYQASGQANDQKRYPICCKLLLRSSWFPGTSYTSCQTAFEGPVQRKERMVFSIRRCVKPVGFGHTVEVRLHHFSDASENAYGTASYLVLVDEQGRTHCSFVMGKSRGSHSNRQL